MQVDNSLRARSIIINLHFFHLGECATYQPAIDWPIQTVIVQMELHCTLSLSKTTLHCCDRVKLLMWQKFKLQVMILSIDG